MSGFNVLTGELVGAEEDLEQQGQGELLVRLREENRFLREQLKAIDNWPDESRDWRGRALTAEKKLALAYARMRELDADIVELKLKIEQVKA